MALGATVAVRLWLWWVGAVSEAAEIAFTTLGAIWGYALGHTVVTPRSDD